MAILEIAPGVRTFVARFGPGLISGAANDDPPCISTFSIAGAAYGHALLWTRR